MQKKIEWVLPEKPDPNLLSKLFPLKNKEILFQLSIYNKIAIQFKVKTDDNSNYPQTYKFNFDLFENDAQIFHSPDIKRTFKNENSLFSTSLAIDSNKVFNQTQNKYRIDIFVEEMDPSQQSPSISHAEKIQATPSPHIKPLYPNKTNVNQFQTPKHLFSPIKIKDNKVVKLEDHDRLEQVAPEIIQPNNISNSSEIKQNTNEQDTKPLISDLSIKKENEESKFPDNQQNNLIQVGSIPSSPFFTPTSPQILIDKKKQVKLSDLQKRIKKNVEDNEDEKDSSKQTELSSKFQQKQPKPQTNSQTEVKPLKFQLKKQSDLQQAKLPFKPEQRTESNSQQPKQPQPESQPQKLIFKSQSESQKQQSQTKQTTLPFKQVQSEPQQPPLLFRPKSKSDNQSDSQPTKLPFKQLHSESQQTTLPFKPKQQSDNQSDSQPTKYPLKPPHSEPQRSTSPLKPSQQTENQSDSQPTKYPLKPPTSDETYCGLFNQGATCYMNSMLQAFYHLPAFRRLIYQIDTSSVCEKDNNSRSVSSSKNIPLQLQKLFATMQTTQERACSTRDLTKSFGWTDEDTFMQQDVQEFCRVILDNLETKIDKQPQLKGSIQRLFRGRVRSYIRCTNVDFESKREEFFYDISLDVKGCSRLKDSFFKYIEKENLNGKNQYDTGDPKFGKQDAVMGNEFIEFPPVLHLHLRRFEFNGNGMSKINSRLEFPPEINLGRFMAKDAKDRENQIFELFGVLVHSGTVDGGHYYAFLRPTEQQKWYRFDDSSVSPVNARDAIENNYGGASNEDSNSSFRSRFNNGFNRSSLMMKNHHLSGMNQPLQSRWFSAYMLIYIRRSAVPYLYKSVNNNEIPDEIKELIIQQEELRRKKEEQKRIQENTIVFRIYMASDICENVSKLNKFCLPSQNDANHCKKYTALRGEKYSVLFEKVINDIKEETRQLSDDSSDDEHKFDFEFWPINYYGVENAPISKDKVINYPSVQSLLLYNIQANELEEEEEEKQKQTQKSENNNLMFSTSSSYPFIILFIFVYNPYFDQPLRYFRISKVKKKDKVSTLLFMVQPYGINVRSIFKSIREQSVEEITDANSTFEDNKLKSGSFLVIETLHPINPQFQQPQENKEKEDPTILKYTNIYKPESVVEYFSILRNMTMIRVITTETNLLQVSSHEYKIYFPKNATCFAFINALQCFFEIPKTKTIILYNSRSKRPLKLDKEKSIDNYLKMDAFRLFQFDQISDFVFEHTLLIKFKIIGSLINIADSAFYCWMNENCTIADFAQYVENTYIFQLSSNFIGLINSGEDQASLSPKEFIRRRVVLNHNMVDGKCLKVLSIKSENLTLYTPDANLENTDTTLLVEINDDEQYIYENIVLNELHQNIHEQQQQIETNSNTNTNNEIINLNINANDNDASSVVNDVSSVVNDASSVANDASSVANDVSSVANDVSSVVNVASCASNNAVADVDDESDVFAGNLLPDIEDERETPSGGERNLVKTSEKLFSIPQKSETVSIEIPVLDDQKAEFPTFDVVHLFVTENAMNRICRTKEQGNSLIHVYEGETLSCIKKRLAWMLGKPPDYFTEEEKGSFTFLLVKPSNQFFKVTLSDKDMIYPKVKEGYSKLKVALSMSAAYRITSSNSNSNSGGNYSSSSSSRTNKDESVVIKN